MNSLFNYELDERQIRLTLHDAELDYSEASWAEFDHAYPGHITTSAKLSQFDLPKINLNINRNVLVPLFFIIALGGVSAIMFRFIDFKTNKPVEIEKALIPDASNFKVAKQEHPSSPESGKHTAAVKTEPKKDTVPVAVNTPPPVAGTSAQPGTPNIVRMPANKPAAPSVALQKPVVTDSAVNTAPDKVTDTTSSAASGQIASNPDTAATDKANLIRYKNTRKRRKKVTADQVESFKAPTLISTQTAEAETEPELRLK